MAQSPQALGRASGIVRPRGRSRRPLRVGQIHGGGILQELKDEDYGSRGYMAKDLEGNHWYFGTYQPGGHW